MYAPSMKILAAALLCVASASARCADLYVICNPGVSLTAADVRDVFLGDKQFSGTVKLLPVDNVAAQQIFLQTVLKMDAAKYSTVWTKKAFRDGLNPPPVQGSDAEALAYVRRTPGACTYTSLATTPGVVVISKY
ncbi:MAG: hypothetical protein JWN85_3907 [Gammaproteobacteria bacterium]|nr:hypothetical protein [Gammaproteobacteria bacterium]